jgi:hypothetical protein
MTTPHPSDPDTLPTGPLRSPSTVRWALLAVVALALLGYLYFANRTTGQDTTPPSAPQSGRVLPPPTGPTQ